MRIADALILDTSESRIREITSLDPYTFSASFCTIVKHILIEYNKDSLHDEYNSIKHGYRVDGRVAEFQVALMDEASNIRPDDSKFSPLISSPSGINFPKIGRIRKTAGTEEVGLEAVNSTINLEKNFQRINQILNLSDIIILGLRGMNNINGGRKTALLAPPLDSRKCWMPDDHEGILENNFRYDLTLAGHESRIWGFSMNVTRRLEANQGVYAFSTNYTDLMMQHTFTKTDIMCLLSIGNFLKGTIFPSLDQRTEFMLVMVTRKIFARFKYSDD